MPTLQEHLETASATHGSTLYNLKCAWNHALAQGYDANWTAAIQKALAVARETDRQIANIATCIDPTAPLPRPVDP